MFKNLIPWKKKNGKLAVHHDEPTRQSEQDYSALAQLRDEFDSLIHRFFDDRSVGDRWLTDRFGNLPSLWDEPRIGYWDLGWEDNGDEYLFQAELPGFEPEDFDIKVSGNMLTVHAEHKDEKKGKNGSSYRYGSFRRSLTLPHGADDSKVDARYHSGILELHLPKTESAQAKRIEVKSA